MNRTDARLSRRARMLRREMLAQHKSLIFQEPLGAQPNRRILKSSEAERVLELLQQGWRPLAFLNGKSREYLSKE